jgi:tetratricopeptide (TPR) repeat protein
VFIFKTRPISFRASSLAVGFLALLLLEIPCLGEGFPGMGDRVKYAESLPHYNLGNRYLNKAWYEKAVEKYRDAIEIYPFDADVYINLGLALRKMNDGPRAEWAYKRAIELKGDDWTAVNNLANLYMLEERFDESLKLFDKALKCPDLPRAEKETIESNILGIKKIMKNRGLVQEAQKKAPTKKVAGKGKAKVGAKKSGTAEVNQASYESWLQN